MYAVHISLTKQNASNYQWNESQTSYQVSIPTTGWDWHGVFAFHCAKLLARAVVKSWPVGMLCARLTRYMHAACLSADHMRVHSCHHYIARASTDALIQESIERVGIMSA